MSSRRRDRIAASLIARMPSSFLASAAVELITRRSPEEFAVISVNDKPAVLLVDLDRKGVPPTHLGPAVIQVLAGAREIE